MELYYKMSGCANGLIVSRTSRARRGAGGGSAAPVNLEWDHGRACGAAIAMRCEMSTPPSQLRCLARILETTGCSLAVSAYASNRVMLIGAESNRIYLGAFKFHRPMGIAARVADGELR
jgi:hypothetical protein